MNTVVAGMVGRFCLSKIHGDGSAYHAHDDMPVRSNTNYVNYSYDTVGSGEKNFMIVVANFYQ